MHAGLRHQGCLSGDRKRSKAPALVGPKDSRSTRCWVAFVVPGDTSMRNRGPAEIARRGAFAAPRRFGVAAVRASVERVLRIFGGVRDPDKDASELTLAAAALPVPWATGCATMSDDM